MILISSIRERAFCRCGVKFPAKSVGPAKFADDRFSAEELEILKAEPMITVEVVKDSPAEPDGEDLPGIKGMTKAELEEELGRYQEDVPVGERNADLREMIQAHREAGSPRRE